MTCNYLQIGVPNYPRKAQAPYTDLIKKTVITNFKNYSIIGWVLVALDAEVRVINGA